MVAPAVARLVPRVQRGTCYTRRTREFVNDERLCGPQRVRSAPTLSFPE